MSIEEKEEDAISGLIAELCESESMKNYDLGICFEISFIDETPREMMALYSLILWCKKSGFSFEIRYENNDDLTHCFFFIDQKILDKASKIIRLKPTLYDITNINISDYQK